MYDLNTSKNPGYPHWNFNRFYLDNWTNDECKTDLRFYKSDVYRLANVLNIPEQIKALNRLTFDGIKALCVFLKHFSYPCSHSDLLPPFGRYVPELSMMSVLYMLITVTFSMTLISHGSVQLLFKNTVNLYMKKEPLYKTALGL